MAKKDSVNKNFFEKQSNYVKPKVLIITLSSKLYQENFLNYTENYYRHELGYDVVNRGNEIRLNPFGGNIVNPITNLDQQTKASRCVLERCRNQNELKLVFATHSFYCWFFSNRITTENDCYQYVASFIYDLERNFKANITDIILDGCHTASEINDIELNERHEIERETLTRNHLDTSDSYGLENKCPARKLSLYFPVKNVYGFVGNSVVKGVVIHTALTKHFFMTSQDNCVIFRFGDVIKGMNLSSEHEVGSGIVQHAQRSCLILDNALGTERRPLIRTKSFSKLV